MEEFIKKIKTFKIRCETLYDKPEEQILNIIVQVLKY